ncbi:GntR family transcriptional regulator [Bacillus cereus]|nr:GntR family transcriptional regulator [Bacillus cereus]PET96040.1 GntR family transcriptional regulator [Bacillus cereus]PEW62959.1 GntR family transcriptional regulator [Bacillus cereus]PEX34193.1 GntR family transcriptional regulator [Bacillus cereus]PEY21298.1 GntR family transcriptional regulator [Bacillus cereus]
MKYVLNKRKKGVYCWGVFKQTNLDKTEQLLLYIMKELEADNGLVKLSLTSYRTIRVNHNTTSKAIKGLKEEGDA